MKKIDPLPCKIHGTIPQIRSVIADIAFNSYVLQLNGKDRKEYYCPACELDKITAEKNELAESWNQKQKS